MRGELRALTALRFVLALYALAYHVLFAWNSITSASAGDPVAVFVSAGYVSVSGFFVLSGFVLTYAYVDSESHALRTSVWRFLWARFARVYPMHVVGISLSVPLVFIAARAAHAHESAIAREAWREIAAVSLLVQAWIPDRALDLNGPAWSLSVEAFFYASFPLLVRTLASLRVRRLFGVAVVAYGLAIAVPLSFPLQNGIADATPRDRVLLFDPLVHWPEFIFGVTTGLLFLATKPVGRPWRLVSCVAAGTLVVTLSSSADIPVGLLHNGLLDPLLALLIFALAASFPPAVSSSRASMMVLFGRASYALYILHKPIYLWMVHERGLGRSVPSPAFLSLYVVVSLALSVALYRAVEQPARRWLGRVAS